MPDAESIVRYAASQDGRPARRNSCWKRGSERNGSSWGVHENYCKQRTPLHTSFERSDGMVAIAQRGINSREREFVATERATPFDRVHDLNRFTPPAHAGIDSCLRSQSDATVCRILRQFPH